MLTTTYNHNENNYKYNNSTSMVTWYTVWLQHMWLMVIINRSGDRQMIEFAEIVEGSK